MWKHLEISRLVVFNAPLRRKKKQPSVNLCADITLFLWTAECVNIAEVLSLSNVIPHTQTHTHSVPPGSLSKHIGSVSPKQPQPPLPPSCYKRTAAPWSLCFLRAEPDQTDTFYGRVPSLWAPDTTPSLPIQTPFVTPGPPELHFYSGRHVRARVRLHLRRVTGNNNTEIGEGRESRWRRWPEMNEVLTETAGKRRGAADHNDTPLPRGPFGKRTKYFTSSSVLTIT